MDSAEGLVALVQFGVIEIHPWGSRQPRLEKPDLVVFDLDPGEGVSFDRLKEAAGHVRARLKQLGLVPFLKATGGKGLHVVAPVEPDTGWESVKAFCAEFAEEIAREEPDAYIATASKAKREGRVFIDYLRNGRGATAICPYSTRARPGAPVAVPLRWSELPKLAAPDAITIETMVARLRRKDPWEGWEDARRSLRG